jgi:hypothetical protein
MRWHTLLAGMWCLALGNNPQEVDRQWLLMHELAHTIQQVHDVQTYISDLCATHRRDPVEHEDGAAVDAVTHEKRFSLHFSGGAVVS